MKYVLLAFLVLSPLNLAAQAAETPLLTKSSGSGFTPPEWARSETCAVFTDRVVISHQFGAGENSFKQVSITRISLSTGIHRAIEMALAEPLKETPNGLCDGPATFEQIRESAPLFSTGGCGSPRKERTGPYSSMLRELLAQHCPRTHDFSHDGG